MDEHFDQLMADAKALKTTEGEASRTRGSLKAFIASKPVRADAVDCHSDQMSEQELSSLAALKQNLRITDAEAQDAERHLRAFVAAHPVGTRRGFWQRL